MFKENKFNSKKKVLAATLALSLAFPASVTALSSFETLAAGETSSTTTSSTTQTRKNRLEALRAACEEALNKLQNMDAVDEVDEIIEIVETVQTVIVEEDLDASIEELNDLYSLIDITQYMLYVTDTDPQGEMFITEANELNNYINRSFEIVQKYLEYPELTAEITAAKEACDDAYSKLIDIIDEMNSKLEASTNGEESVLESYTEELETASFNYYNTVTKYKVLLTACMNIFQDNGISNVLIGGNANQNAGTSTTTSSNTSSTTSTTKKSNDNVNDLVKGWYEQYDDSEDY